MAVGALRTTVEASPTAISLIFVLVVALITDMLSEPVLVTYTAPR
jgi:hypothetical protein